MIFRALRCSILAIMACLAASALAGAQTMSVGDGCAYSDLQPAIDAAPTSGAEIHLSKNLTNQHVTITAKSLSIIGGFADCTSATPTRGNNTISAGSHTGDSVITISSIANIVLKNLTISDGKESNDGYGGGIDYVGHGSLVLDNVEVYNNRAGYGGGIHVDPNGPMALRLQNGTSILGNTAANSGGGIRIEGRVHMYMLDSTTSISNNITLESADGHGGGLQVIGPAIADIGSGVISGNSARYGGGIYVEGSLDSNAVDSGFARLFRTSPYVPARIVNNKASRSGGGVFVLGEDDAGDDGRFFGVLCGFGYDISGNSAQEGSAIYADNPHNFYHEGGRVVLSRAEAYGSDCGSSESPQSLGALDCPIDQPCNTIDNNIAQTSAGEATEGATVMIQTYAVLTMEKTRISHNRGGYAVRAFEAAFSGPFAGPARMTECLISDNVFTRGIIRTEDDDSSDFWLTNSTIAGNTLGSGASVFRMAGSFTLGESIIWAPGTPLLAGTVSLIIGNVIGSEVASLGGPFADVLAVPDVMFKNLAQGNYRLTPASPAVDFTGPTANLGDLDLDNRPRVVGVYRQNQPLDLGAYELQTLAQFPPDENFDEAVPPAPPDGWVSTRTGGGTAFYVTSTAASSAPNALFTDDPAVTSNKRVSTPEFDVVRNGRLTFRHKVDLEAGYDGAVLEIAIGAGAYMYTDIIAAGGRFVTGGYNATLNGAGNPLGAVPAWTDDSGGFQTVVVDLPPSANGQTVKLRWHVGTDMSTAGGGYWLDDVHVDVDGSVTDRIFCNGLETTPCD